MCDAGGHLLVLNRMDGASAVNATVAQGKAVASAGFGRPSGALAGRLSRNPVHHRHPGGRMLPAQRAMPIDKNGDLGGALGGSGATAQQDEEWAQAGEAALYTTPHEMWRLASRHMPGHERTS